LNKFENLSGVKELIASEAYKKLNKMPPAYVAEGYNVGI